MSKYVIMFRSKWAYEGRLPYIQIQRHDWLANRKPPPPFLPSFGLWVPPFHPDQELSQLVTAAADLTPGAERKVHEFIASSF